MAFKPNYGRDRAERDRAARARTEEKQKKKEEKLAQRKAERDAAHASPDESVKTAAVAVLAGTLNPLVRTQSQTREPVP